MTLVLNPLDYEEATRWIPVCKCNSVPHPGMQIAVRQSDLVPRGHVIDDEIGPLLMTWDEHRKASDERLTKRLQEFNKAAALLLGHMAPMGSSIAHMRESLDTHRKGT